MTAERPNYWMGVAARTHVRAAVAGGFAQLGHGKLSAVRSLRPDDWIVYYSPKTEIDGGEVVQAFTALGRVTGDGAYRVEQGTDFCPFRVDVEYRKDAADASVRPLLPALELTKNRGTRWGIAFRGSKARLSPADFVVIAEAMGVGEIATARL